MLVAWQRVKRSVLGVWDDDSEAPSRLMAALVRVLGFLLLPQSLVPSRAAGRGARGTRSGCFRKRALSSTRCVLRIALSAFAVLTSRYAARRAARKLDSSLLILPVSCLLSPRLRSGSPLCDSVRTVPQMWHLVCTGSAIPQCPWRGELYF